MHVCAPSPSPLSFTCLSELLFTLLRWHIHVAWYWPWKTFGSIPRGDLPRHTGEQMHFWVTSGRVWKEKKIKKYPEYLKYETRLGWLKISKQRWWKTTEEEKRGGVRDKNQTDRRAGRLSTGFKFSYSHNFTAFLSEHLAIGGRGSAGGLALRQPAECSINPATLHIAHPNTHTHTYTKARARECTSWAICSQDGGELRQLYTQ